MIGRRRQPSRRYDNGPAGRRVMPAAARPYIDPWRRRRGANRSGHHGFNLPSPSGQQQQQQRGNEGGDDLMLDRDGGDRCRRPLCRTQGINTPHTRILCDLE